MPRPTEQLRLAHGLILAAGTGPGRLFPGDSADTTAALVGIAPWR
ncbi:hypothetical protein [Nocardia implantans]|uniref:Uncharacterized protein n=1 Tax=Nocardia implantans TaxID=3108168 RepID=A0ABU6AY32_9NOCA|nr:MULTISPECIES: hypothetical protein [unclassified Nocardia]MEA3528448.1 hypothetical protein [Nocardia sp. CDC192]MEB3512400.1 hypothetical protein [Nocardia sp. CDC186]